jgi:hypothetical protein
MATDKMTVELVLNRRYNLGNFNHKEYTIKVSGTEETLEHDLTAKKMKLLGYLSTLEELIDIAHDGNVLKDLQKKAAESGEKDTPVPGNGGNGN